MQQVASADGTQIPYENHRGNAAFFLSGFGLPRAAVDDRLDSPAGQMMIDSARAATPRLT